MHRDLQFGKGIVRLILVLHQSLNDERRKGNKRLVVSYGHESLDNAGRRHARGLSRARTT